MNRFIKIYADSFQGLNKDVYIFAAMMLINRIGTLILPFLTLYITQELGWTTIDAGTGTMWFGLGSLAGALLGGVLTDKIGYYRTMAISLFSAGVFFYLLQFISEFYMFCGFLFVSSLLGDLIRPALWSGITYFTNKSNQTRAVSLLRMAFNAGIAIGPAIAGSLIEQYGYSLIFTIDGVTCIAAGIFLLVFVENKKEKQDEENKIEDRGISPYRDTLFMVFMGLNMVMLISFFQILFTVPLFMTEVLGYSEKEVGYFFTVNGLMILFIEMPLVYYMESYYSKFKSMMIGASLIGLSILIFIFPVRALDMIVFYTIFVSIGEIINFPFISSASMDRASKGNIGKYMSVNTVMFSLALIIAPKVGTLILAAYGYNILFIIMALLCAVSVLALYFMQSHFERK
ncbi:MAG: MFS transporter [Saprospiraceae bacterium]|nr:MFS transporter [Saprospiraceae bacterium]